MNSKTKPERQKKKQFAETDPLSHTDEAFPIVGIGASAGGLAAFEAFFSGTWPMISASGPSTSCFRALAATAPWVFRPSMARAISYIITTAPAFTWNPAALRMNGWSEAEALVMNIRDRIPEGLRQ